MNALNKMGAKQAKKLLDASLYMDEDVELKKIQDVYECDDLGELKEGVCFNVSGTVLQTCEQFIIAFLVDNKDDDIVLNLNARLPQNFISRNTRLKKRWQVGESASSLPFTLRRGQDFAIQVLIRNSSFLISLNGYHFASYLHYIPYKLIRKLKVRGQVTNVSMKRMEVQTYPERITSTRNVEIILTGSAIDTHYDTGFSGSKWRRDLAKRVIRWSEEISAPYLAAFPRNTLKPGRYLKIDGRVKLLPTSFYINLQRDVCFWPHPIVAFHFAPMFSSKSENIAKAKIVRRAWYDGSWSPEECSDIDTEFLPGKKFRMAIVCSEYAYRVFLNGKFLLEFKYHMRPETVDTIYIRGDVKLHWVSLHSSKEVGIPRYSERSTLKSTTTGASYSSYS